MRGLREILLSNGRLIALCASVFLLGIPAGIIIYPQFADKMAELLANVFGGIMEGSDAQIILKVFARNMMASVFMMLLGFTILLSIASLFLNGLLVGLVFGFADHKGIGAAHIALGIIPHGIFELPALFISAALGMRVGLQFLTQRGHRVSSGAQAIREASAAYLLLVIPLLAVAAAIEILVSKRLIG